MPKWLFRQRVNGEGIWDIAALYGSHLSYLIITPLCKEDEIEATGPSLASKLYRV